MSFWKRLLGGATTEPSTIGNARVICAMSGPVVNHLVSSGCSKREAATVLYVKARKPARDEFLLDPGGTIRLAGRAQDALNSRFIYEHRDGLVCVTDSRIEGVADYTLVGSVDSETYAIAAAKPWASMLETHSLMMAHSPERTGCHQAG